MRPVRNLLRGRHTARGVAGGRAPASARHRLLPTLAGYGRKRLAADVVAGLWAGAVVVLRD